jgi:hypothetical protein
LGVIFLTTANKQIANLAARKLPPWTPHQEICLGVIFLTTANKQIANLAARKFPDFEDSGSPNRTNQY